MSGAAAAATAYRSPAAIAVGVVAIASSAVVGNNLVGYGLEPGGDIRQTLDAMTSDVGDWLSPKVGMAGFEVQATLVSSTSSAISVTGPIGAWVGLGALREWTLLATAGVPDVTAELTIEIRQISNHLVVASASIELQSTYVP